MPDWTTILGLLAAGGVGGLIVAGATALRYRGQDRRETRAENRADRLSWEEEAARERERRLRAEEERDESREMHRDCADDLKALRRRVESIEEAVPLALVAPNLLEPMASGVEAVLNHLRCLVAITTPDGDGRFLWVNKAWEDALGYSREEILRVGWRSLIHPEDLERTGSTEGGAWVGVVRIVNRYRHSDGRYVRLRWCASPYRGGVSLASARVLSDGGSES